MAKPDDDGPLLVWSFPLIRTFQNRDGLLSMGLGDVLNNGTSSRDDSETQRREQSESTSTSMRDGDDVLDDIEDSIDELGTNSDMLYGESSEDATVQVDEDGFNPDEVSVGIGDTVSWVNQGDTTARISSVDDDFTSPILDPGDTYEETFYTPGEIKYKDPTSGSSDRGIIEVGPDAEPSGIDPVPFDSEDDDSDDQSSESTRSMDQAATDKDDDDRGF